VCSQSIVLRCIVTADCRPADSANDLALLDSEERRKVSRFFFAEDRRDYAAAHALLRRLLTEVSPDVAPKQWRFERTTSGKPYLPPEYAGVPPLEFSISHARGMVACAVCRGLEVGVDVEVASQIVCIDTLPTNVCSADEKKQLSVTAAGNRVSLFLDLWALKEAYAKARGLGLSTGLHRASFDLRSATIVSSFLGESANGWHFALIKPVPGSRVGLAIAASAAAPVLDAKLTGRIGEPKLLRAERMSTPFRLS
jgi:4'-phosphopantetheinyl transferase